MSTPDHLHNALQSLGAWLLDLDRVKQQREREQAWMREVRTWLRAEFVRRPGQADSTISGLVERCPLPEEDDR